MQTEKQAENKSAAKPKKERWLLEFERAGPEVEPDGSQKPPLARVIAQLLKTAGRCYGLRCVRNVMSQEGHVPPVDPKLDCTKHEPPF